MRMRLLNIGTTSQQRSLSQGLIAYWKLDEVDGSALDSVGIYNGAISYDISQNTTGKINNAYIFNGSEGLLSFPVISLGTTFSISAWIKKDGTGDNYGMCFGDFDGSQGLYIGNSGKFDYFYSGTSHVTVNNVFDDLTWSHFVISVSSGTGEGYVNCNKVIDLTSIPAFDFQCFGHYSPDSSDWFNFVWKGALDEVGIWNRPLTINDISTLYNLGVGRSYPFGQQIVTDNFESYTDGNINGQGDWLNGVNEIDISTSTGNKCFNASGTDKRCFAYKNLPDFSANQECKVTINTLTTPGKYVYAGVAVRCSSLNMYGYRMGAIERIFGAFVNGTWGTLASVEGDGNKAGDVVGIRVIGTTITCLINGRIDTSMGNATLPATGTAGVYVDDRISSGTPGICGAAFSGYHETTADYFVAWEI